MSQLCLRKTYGYVRCLRLCDVVLGRGAGMGVLCTLSDGRERNQTMN